jgi:hypothetical protein
MKNNAVRTFYGLSVLAGSALVMALSTPAEVNAQAPGANVCLNVTEIRNTEVQDMRTIIYRMWNGDVWRNDLAFACPDLVQHSAGGYTQNVPIGGWVCARRQTITTQTGTVCRLGNFTRIN